VRPVYTELIDAAYADDLVSSWWSHGRLIADIDTELVLLAVDPANGRAARFDDREGFVVRGLDAPADEPTDTVWRRRTLLSDDQPTP